MMNGKKIIPYVIAILVFVIASLAYFSPVLKGKKIQQSDITQYIGSSKEIVSITLCFPSNIVNLFDLFLSSFRLSKN